VTALLDQATEPFGYPFMVNAFAITLTIAVPMALLSCFLVLRGWSLMGDAISHAVLPGIVAAYVMALPLAVGAFVAGLACALLTGFINDNCRVKEDTVMGVVFSGMFGLGLVMYVAVPTDMHLDHILFGDMLGVSACDIAETAAIAAACTAFAALKWRDLLALGFDAQHAGAIGLPVRFLHYGLLAAVSLAVVGALKAVGIILSIAFLVTPGAVGFLATRRFPAMLGVALATAVATSVIGIYLSFFLDSAPAPTIVLLMAAVFLAALFARMRATRATSSASA
jgi:manganese/iron transport system permease protein